MKRIKIGLNDKNGTPLLNGDTIIDLSSSVKYHIEYIAKFAAFCGVSGNKIIPLHEIYFPQRIVKLSEEKH